MYVWVFLKMSWFNRNGWKLRPNDKVHGSVSAGAFSGFPPQSKNMNVGVDGRFNIVCAVMDWGGLSVLPALLLWLFFQQSLGPC